jgi:hypothetical protein
MLAQAIGVKGGLAMHSEIYGHYGPMAPWSQAVFLYLPFSEALALRIWAAVHLGATAGLISDFWRVLPGRIAVRPWVARLSAVTWVSMSDVFIQGNLLPWSSIQGIFLVVLAVYLLLLSRKLSVRNSRFSRFCALFAGLAVGVLPFSRINVGLAFWLVCIAVVILDFRFSENFVKRLGRFFLLGWAVGVSAVGIVLAISQSLNAYWTQAVQGPLSWASTVVDERSGHPLGDYLAPFVYSSVPAIFFLALSFAMPWFFVKRGWIGGRRYLGSLLLVQVSLAVAMYVFVAFTRRGKFRELIAGDLDWGDLKNELIWGRPNALYFLVFLAGIVGLALAIDMVARRKGPWVWKPEFSAIFLLLGGAASSLAQSFPLNDFSHVWWGAALAPLVLLVGLSYFFAKRLMAAASTLVFVAVVLTGGVVDGWILMQQERVPAPRETIVKDLSVRPEIRDLLADALEVIPDYEPGMDVAFIVNDGVLAVLRGTYVAVDENYVWWADPSRSIDEVMQEADVAVLQENTVLILGYRSLSDFIQKNELEEIRCVDSFCSARKAG